MLAFPLRSTPSSGRHRRSRPPGTGPAPAPGASSFRAAAAGAVLALLFLLSAAADGPAAAQETGTTTEEDAAHPELRVVAPLGLGLFVDPFIATNPVNTSLGAGVGLGARFAPHIGLRVDGQVLVVPAADIAAPGGTAGAALFGFVIYPGGGPGPRAHLRFGPMIGTSGLGSGGFLAGGVPLSEHVRLEGRGAVVDRGLAVEAAVSLVVP